MGREGGGVGEENRVGGAYMKLVTQWQRLARITKESSCNTWDHNQEMESNHDGRTVVQDSCLKNPGLDAAVVRISWTYLRRSLSAVYISPDVKQLKYFEIYYFLYRIIDYIKTCWLSLRPLRFPFPCPADTTSRTLVKGNAGFGKEAKISWDGLRPKGLAWPCSSTSKIYCLLTPRFVNTVKPTFTYRTVNYPFTAKFQLRTCFFIKFIVKFFQVANDIFWPLSRQTANWSQTS